MDHMRQGRRRAYRGGMSVAEWLQLADQADLFDPPTENPTKMLNLASDILLDPEARSDALEARERLKTACARAGILYHSDQIEEALRKARGRIRA